MRLPELQQQFQHSVLTRDASIRPELIGALRQDFDARLGAYVEGYRSRLVEALGSTYPALMATLGEERFDARMREYIESTPSQHYSVRYYGAGIAALMASEGSPGERAALYDLARWEWLLAEVFDAPDDAPLDEAAFARVAPQAWAEVRFNFRACLRRTGLRSNAIDFWRASKKECAPPAALEAAPPTEWLLWRRGTSTLFRSIEPVEAGALDGALSGLSFGALCEQMAGSVEETQVALRAASLLRSWIAEELIAGITLPDAPP